MEKMVWLFKIALVCLGLSALTGAMSNFANGWVSPGYFTAVMHWEIEGANAVWRAAIAQGIFEGLMFGIFFAVIFTAIVGFFAEPAYGLGKILRYAAGMVLFAVLGWLLGGIIGLGMALLSPEYFAESFYQPPESYPEMLRYAWVGGSINGIYAGAVIALVLGSIGFRFYCKRLDEQTNLSNHQENAA